MQAKLVSVLAEVRERQERRNCYLNLAYTAPHENTPLQKDISYEKVATVALDMFVDTSQAVSAPEPKVQAVSAADEEETITPKDKPSPLERIAALPKIPWRIPQQVERGYEIPICVTENYRLEIGKFCRLGMDIVVNAV